MVGEGDRAWAVGDEIGGKYLLVRLLGEGSAGAVFEAENLWTGRHAALKVLHPPVSARQDMVARFTQEARIAARITHPNIVEVLDMGRDGADGELYIVQELLRGEDLRAWLSSRGRVDARAAVAIVAPIASALAAMHAMGVLHRDVKPENIFLTREEDGRIIPKLIDFGISKVLDPGAGSGLQTSISRVLGTPDYMAPEQVRAGEPVDARMDVWGLGVVLFELLTGRCPYTAPTVNLLILKIATELPPPVRSVAPEVPEALAVLVDSALEPELSRRLGSCSAFFERLTALELASQHAPTPTPARLPATLPPPPGEEGASEEGQPEGARSFAPQPALSVLGEDDPRALERALPAEWLLVEGRLPVARSRAEEALSQGGLTSVERGRLLLVCAVARRWLGDVSGALPAALEALSRLPRGEGAWLAALGQVASLAALRGETERLVALSRELEPSGRVVATPARALAASRLAAELSATGWTEVAGEVLSAFDALPGQDQGQHLLAQAWRLWSQASTALFEGAPLKSLRLAERAVVAFDTAADPCHACLARADVGRALGELGVFDGAEGVLRGALDEACSLGVSAEGALRAGLGRALASRGALDEAYPLLVDALGAAVSQGDGRLEGLARVWLAGVLSARGEHALAEREAKAALELPSQAPPTRVIALAAQAEALVGQRRWMEALDASERAMARFHALGGLGQGEMALRSVYARALDGCGHRAAACAAVAEALRLLRVRAGRISDPSLRARYWEEPPEHRLLLALMLAWQVDEG